MNNPADERDIAPNRVTTTWGCWECDFKEEMLLNHAVNAWWDQGGFECPTCEKAMVLEMCSLDISDLI